MRCAIAVVFVGLAPVVARADATVDVTLNSDGAQLASQLGVSVQDLEQIAQDRIDELYKLQRLDELLRAFANTAAFTQRGLGVEYDVDPGDLMIGYAGTGVHGDVAIGTTNELLGGSIINFEVMAGANLARLEHPQWTVFANGYYETVTIHGLEGHLLTLASHVQYQIVPARGSWIGLSATTGLEYARLELGTAGSIESHFTATGPAEHATVHMSSTGTLSVLAQTFTVPIEVSTGVRLADVISLYTAAGLDVTGGSSTIEARLDSVLSINADNLPVGTAVITGSGASSPSAVTVHALAGLALHTKYVRVFVQGALAPGELAVALGVRFAAR